MSNENKLSRREFIKDAAIGAAAVAGAGVLGATPAQAQTQCPIPGVPAKWDYEADIVVVGTGMAAMSTAITAFDAGAKVLILEKMAQAQEGGNSKVCMQFIWAPKDLEGGIKYIKGQDCGMTDEEFYPLMAQGLMDNIKVIQNLGGKIAPVNLGGAPFAELPGASSYETWATTLDGTTGVTGEGRLWLFFRDQVQKRGIQVLYETPAVDLIQSGATKEILGVYATSKGNKLAVKAKKGVVLACGGFEFDYAMQKQYFWGAPILGLGTPGNTGDGIKMALKVGADLWHMNEPNGGDPSMLKVGENQFVIIAPGGNSLVWVDKLGKRYTTEKGGTRSHATGTVTLNFDAQAMDWARIPTWVIFDDATLKAGPLAFSTTLGVGGGKWTWYFWQTGYLWSKDNSEEVKKGWILKADTLAELAAKIKADPDNGGRMDAATLDATLKTYNKYCADKNDLDYRRAAATLAEIKGPPYYAVKLWPGTANTQGGPKRNKFCQIVGPDKNPIQRLYGTGELGSFWGYTYSSGGNIGECMFSGRIAANHAVALKAWDASA